MPCQAITREELQRQLWHLQVRSCVFAPGGAACSRPPARVCFLSAARVCILVLSRPPFLRSSLPPSLDCQLPNLLACLAAPRGGNPNARACFMMFLVALLHRGWEQEKMKTLVKVAEEVDYWKQTAAAYRAGALSSVLRLARPLLCAGCL